MTTYIIALSIALVLLLIVFYFLTQIKSINKNAETVEGIIYEKTTETDSDFDNINSSSTYPVIRFVTNEQKWITKKYDLGFFSGTYKQGNKVIVVYSKNNPEKFYLKDKKTNLALIFLFIVSLVIISICTNKLWLA